MHEPIFSVIPCRKDRAIRIRSRQRLPYCFYDSIIRKTRCQCIDRLHGIPLFLVFGRRVIDLRMLHDKPVFPADYTSSQNQDTASGKRISQERHTEPDYLYRSGKILQIQSRDLQLSVCRNLYPPKHTACYGINLPFFRLPDGDRVFEDLICPGVIADQITYSPHIQTTKKFLSFCADSFQLPYAASFVHIVFAFLHTCLYRILLVTIGT